MNNQAVTLIKSKRAERNARREKSAKLIQRTKETIKVLTNPPKKVLSQQDAVFFFFKVKLQFIFAYLCEFVLDQKEWVCPFWVGAETLPRGEELFIGILSASD